jgi:hypothetical protein
VEVQEFRWYRCVTELVEVQELRWDKCVTELVEVQELSWDRCVTELMEVQELRWYRCVTERYMSWNQQANINVSKNGVFWDVTPLSYINFSVERGMPIMN